MRWGGGTEGGPGGAAATAGWGAGRRRGQKPLAQPQRRPAALHCGRASGRAGARRVVCVFQGSHSAITDTVNRLSGRRCPGTAVAALRSCPARPVVETGPRACRAGARAGSRSAGRAGDPTQLSLQGTARLARDRQRGGRHGPVERTSCSARRQFRHEPPPARGRVPALCGPDLRPRERDQDSPVRGPVDERAAPPPDRSDANASSHDAPQTIDNPQRARWNRGSDGRGAAPS
jgi:hypothetical protein